MARHTDPSALSWEVAVPLWSNPLIVGATAKVFLFAVIGVAAMLSLIFLIQGETSAIGPLWLAFAAVGAGLFVLALLIMAVVFGNRLHCRFTIDAQGYCNIVGRVKDMLIRGGENVYPREIEEFLFRHPKVSQVQVFGVPDARFGEEVCAWIVLKAGEQATEDEIRAHCRERIAHYKVPRYVRFVQELPMTVTGKAQKFVMRERMLSELGLAEHKSA